MIYKTYKKVFHIHQRSHDTTSEGQNIRIYTEYQQNIIISLSEKRNIRIFTEYQQNIRISLTENLSVSDILIFSLRSN